MSKSPEIKTNPTTLQTLRETAGYTIGEVANKLKTTIDKIREAESLPGFLTLSQIKKMADIYHRPIAAFFTDVLPKMPALSDYRINRDKRLTPKVYIAERRAYYLANKLAELIGKKSRIPNYPDTLKADELAGKFSEYLGFDLLKPERSGQFLDHYKRILEERLLILIIELPLKADDVRGFSILSEISCIVLNEEDNSQIKLFSLFHEVCHLINRTSGICTIELEQENEDIERYCDSFAAEFLVPLANLKKQCEQYSTLDDTAISELSTIYGVSKQVIMLRLLSAGRISAEKYHEFKREGTAKIKAKSEKTFAIKNWNKVFRNRVGSFAIREINGAFRSGKITYSEAFDLLNTKSKYVEKFLGQ